MIEKNIEYESQNSFFKIEVVKGIFKERSILAFSLENYEIKKGDYVIIRTPETTFFKKEILDIQVNHKSYEELEVKEETDVAVNLGSGIMKSQTFYLKKKLMSDASNNVQRNEEANAELDSIEKRTFWSWIRNFLQFSK